MYRFSYDLQRDMSTKKGPVFAKYFWKNTQLFSKNEALAKKN
jgi:hypothetical protein